MASFNWLSKKISKRKIKPEKTQVALIIPKIEGDVRDAQQNDDAGCLPLIIRRHNVLNGLIFEANKVSIKDEENLNNSKLIKKTSSNFF